MPTLSGLSVGIAAAWTIAATIATKLLKG